jgi:hypothetical protein
MSTSTSAFGPAAGNRRNSSRKASSHNFLGGAAVASLVLGCVWTVYANVLGASIYPSVNGADFDAPVIRRPALAARSTTPAANNVLAALPEPAPVISKPETVAAITPIMFNERFAASAPQGEPSRVTEVAAATPAPVSMVAAAPKLADLPKPKEATPPPAQVALNIPAPPAESKPARTPGAAVRDMAQRAKTAVMSIASSEKLSITEKLWGKRESRPSLLSFASADASVTGSLPGGPGQSQNPALGGSAPYDRSTAVYDISAHMVYLPDGTKLEAHSGLGSKLDDPRSAPIRMHGVTPPHIYDLTPREALFHGVPALRLTPVGGDEAIFGRSGLLAHSFMLGPNGDSNGCVSFRDYNAFLNAYRNQGIKRLAVVARVE